MEYNTIINNIFATMELKKSAINLYDEKINDYLLSIRTKADETAKFICENYAGNTNFSCYGFLLRHYMFEYSDIDLDLSEYQLRLVEYVDGARLEFGYYDHEDSDDDLDLNWDPAIGFRYELLLDDNWHESFKQNHDEYMMAEFEKKKQAFLQAEITFNALREQYGK